MNMSDRIAIMRAGQFEQVGTPEDVYDRPQTNFAARFIGQTNLLSGEVLSLENGLARLRVGEALVEAAPGGYTPRVGERAAICLRTERVRLLKEAQGFGLAGTVRERHYAGGSLRFTIEAQGQTIHAQAVDAAAFAPGESVFVSWDARAVSLVPEADA